MALSMLSMLNPGPGLAEEFDCEKLKVIALSKKASTIPNLRIRKVSLGQRVRFYAGPFAKSNRAALPAISPSSRDEVDPVIIKSHRFFEAGVPMTSTNGNGSNGYSVPKPRAEWV